MTNEEAILHMILRREELKNSVGDLDEDIKAFDMAIRALEIIQTGLLKDCESCRAELPCTDAISRQAVCNIVDAIRDCISVDGYWAILERLKQLPSVSTEKTGRWEWVQYDFDPNLGNWHCSECRNILVHAVKKDDVGGIPIAKYCPNCGRRMMEQPYKGEKNTSKGFEDFMIKSLQRQAESEDTE